jgi:hypothetical protein
VRKSEKEKSYTKGTDCPDYQLIPFAALTALANRFGLGKRTYGAKAWNAESSQDALDDVEFIRARLGHAIKHASLALAKINGEIPDDGDDDAGAIMWAGAMLASHKARAVDGKRCGEARC